MVKQWRMRSAAEQWRQQQRKAELIAAEVKAGTAHPDDVAWLKRWRQQQRREQFQAFQAGQRARAHSEARALDARMARDRDPPSG
jgi:hypothetical protein